MKKVFILSVCLLFAAFSLELAADGGNVVSVERFGAVPDDGENDFDALRRAAEYCRVHPGTVLRFEDGVYDIYNKEAVRIEREAISGAYGEHVQEVLFRPDGPYVKAFDLEGCRDVVIQGRGATLLLHGWYEVISVVRAQNVRIEGLRILYQRPPATVGRVTVSNEDYFDAVIDTTRYKFLDSLLTGRLHFYDSQRDRLYTGRASSKCMLSADTMRFYSKVHPPVGDKCLLRHGGHYRPAIMIKESENVCLKDVTIHSQPGMGVVGHLSKDILMDGLQVIPEEGNVIATNTDATHFTSCSGTITIRGCKFKGQGDDCTNIHNYYYNIYPEGEKRVEIRVQDADLHALSLDYPTVGDTMTVISRRNMSPQGSYVVTQVDTSSIDWKVSIELDRPINVDDIGDYLMTNHTRFPRVEILDNHVESHLGRSFLIKSRNVRIIGNDIHGSVGTAIKLGAELSWNESGPSENVLIENNHITGSGYGSKVDATCVTLSTEALETPPFLNRNIIIRNNVFDTERPEDSIILKDGENIFISDNQVKAEEYVKMGNCRNVIK